MIEASGPPPSSPAPQKLKPWVIVLAVAVVVCCFCVGVIGLILAFGDPILQELGLSASFPSLLIL